MKRSRSSESSELEPETQPQSACTVSSLTSLNAPVSPPQVRAKLTQEARPESPRSSTEIFKISAKKSESETGTSQQAIQRGEVNQTENLNKILERLSRYIRQPDSQPRISMSDWISLYQRNAHPEGRHFVIHQHDHPLSGPHYDLRLQFSETSTVCWSVMYGLPGDPNSVRLNRNATETRVHGLEYNLKESASTHNGSTIIWDTGEYEILPYYQERGLPETDDSRSEASDHEMPEERPTESSKLREAFMNRKIRVRLHGTRLPKKYTFQLVLDKSTNIAMSTQKGPKRRRRPLQSKRDPSPVTSNSDSEPDPQGLLSDQQASRESASLPTRPDGSSMPETSKVDQADHSDENVDTTIRRNNAYPGSSNAIGSIHQRRWWLSLDRENSGFERKHGLDANDRAKTWVRKSSEEGFLGFEPFYVRGPDVDRSVVTGRLGYDVFDDEDVQGFIPRKGWRPVLK